MSDLWVVNASPVITLAKAGHLLLLERIPTELLLPEAVVAEIAAGPQDDPARLAVEAGWGKRAIAGSVPDDILEWGLGPGENAVLAIARQSMPCTAILDDAVARNCAKAIGLTVIGTLGVVLRAKQRALIGSAADVMRALVGAGLHLDDGTIRAALGRVGEAW